MAGKKGKSGRKEGNPGNKGGRRPPLFGEPMTGKLPGGDCQEELSQWVRTQAENLDCGIWSYIRMVLELKKKETTSAS